jgi:hypothetical protein
MFDVGALPEECLILKKLGRIEARPKIKINKILHLLKQKDVMLYNYWNNFPNLTEFYENNYNKLGIKKITKMEVKA